MTDDRPGHIDERQVVRAIKTGRAIATTGPLPLVRIESIDPCLDVRTGLFSPGTTPSFCGVGEMASVFEAAQVRIEVRAPAWQKIDMVRIIVNSATVAVVRGMNATLRTIERSIPVTRDSWLVVEVSGSESLFPVIRPTEIPNIRVSAALESVIGAFGLGAIFGGGPLPPPSEIGPVFPYAFTNPVFIDADRDGRFTPPVASASSALRRTLKTEVPALPEPTVLKLFSAFGHGH